MGYVRPLHPTEEDIDNDILIDEVEVRVLLYDKAHPDYSNQTKKTIAWEEIGAEVFHWQWKTLGQLQKTEACKCLQKRWKNIRACFSRELREQRNEQVALVMGRSLKKRRKYLHFDRLHFLQKTLEANDELSESDGLLPVEVVLEEGSGEADDFGDSRESLPRQKKRKVEENTTGDEGLLEMSGEHQEEEEGEIYLPDGHQEVADSIVPYKHQEAADTSVHYKHQEAADPSVHYKRQEVADTSVHYKRQEVADPSVHHKRQEVADYSVHHKRQEVADSSVHYDQEMNFALSLVPLLKRLPKERRLPTEIAILQLIQKETIGD